MDDGTREAIGVARNLDVVITAAEEGNVIRVYVAGGREYGAGWQDLTVIEAQVLRRGLGRLIRRIEKRQQEKET